MEVNFCIGDGGLFKGGKDLLADGVDIDTGDFSFGEAFLESLEVVFEGEKPAAVASYDLVNAVAEIGSAIGPGRVELLKGYDFIVYHCKFHFLAPKGTMPAETAVFKQFNLFCNKRLQNNSALSIIFFTIVGSVSKMPASSIY